ncbi:MAG TPA: hypothetical protein VFG50_05895 [Rhodothermales bacterium]|nr:hypothetical protein [Rhodothermales bacterium]
MRASLRYAPTVALLVGLAFLSACTPRLSPLYRDYAVPDSLAPRQEVMPLIRTALADAGWDVQPSPLENAVRTKPRTLSKWGLYRVTIYVEAVPIGGNYVRVFFNPYREYITGGRTEIPYLKKSLQAAVLPALNEAMEERGLEAVGAPPKDKVVS